jgi:hypothetical protein
VSATGFMGLGVLVINKKVLQLSRFKSPLVLISGFMGWQLVVFVISDGEKLQQFFGATGRNTGLITYLALSILFVVSMASSAIFLNRFLTAALVVGDWVNP